MLCPRHPSRLLRPAAVALTAALVLLAGCEPPPEEGKRIGNSCPEIAGADADGKEVRLSEYKGKVVLVNFWGTWCAPCRSMIPREKQLVGEKYRDRPFAILGVAQDSPDTLAGFLKRNPLPWPNIADGQPGVVARQWNVDGVPSMLLVDHHGVIRARWFDGLNPDDVWEAVDRAVVAAERE